MYMSLSQLKIICFTWEGHRTLKEELWSTNLAMLSQQKRCYR